MPHWSPDCTEFTVSVNICGNRGYQSTVPMPIVEMLGRPARITFRIRGDEIVVVRGPDNAQARGRRGGGGGAARGRGRGEAAGARRS